MNHRRWMRLFYLDDSNSFDEFDIESWRPENIERYYLVRKMPLAEMFCQQPDLLAEELIQMTMHVQWRLQQRRPITCGDIFFCGEESWIYADAATVKSISPKTVCRLPSWSEFTIVNLTQEIKSWNQESNYTPSLL